MPNYVNGIQYVGEDSDPRWILKIYLNKYTDRLSLPSMTVSLCYLHGYLWKKGSGIYVSC